MLRFAAINDGAVVVPSSLGDILFGTRHADTLVTQPTYYGMAGMAGSDTLTGSAKVDLLVGDYLDVALFDGPAVFNAKMIGRDVLYAGDGADFLDGGAGQ